MADAIEEGDHRAISKVNRKTVGSTVQFLGGASISVAAFGVSVLVGLVVTGVVLVVVGTVIEAAGSGRRTQQTGPY